MSEKDLYANAGPDEDIELQSHQPATKRRQSKMVQTVQAVRAVAYIGATIWLLWSTLGIFTKPCLMGKPTSGPPLDMTDDDPLNIFQVQHPLPAEYGDYVATQTIVDTVFSNSYGQPFVATYRPPSDVEFTHVALSLSGSVYGRQFDRLSHVFIGDVEIWRPSTPEPGGQTVVWDFVKDVSRYASLFQTEQEVSMVLNNVVNDKYTGPITVKIDAYFYNVPQDDSDKEDQSIAGSYSESRAADTITPIVPENHPSGHIYALPQKSIEVSLDSVPRNTTRAVLDVYASGNAAEEFWYGHLLDRYDHYFSSKANDFGGRGPIRSVEVYIDDVYAGFVEPYPVIYTGGMSPALWSPIVNLKAYDVPVHQVDVTPFLGKLYDGAKVRIQMTNELDKNVPQTEKDWLVTASLMSWQVAGVEGAASDPVVSHKPHSTQVGFLSPDKKGLVQAISTRQSFTSSCELSFNGEPVSYSWSQSGHSSNAQTVGNSGEDQEIAHSQSGKDSVTINGDTVSTFKYEYSLAAGTKLIGDNDNHGYNISIALAYAVSDGEDNKVSTGQAGHTYSRINGHDFLGGEGVTEQRYHSEIDFEEFDRHVKARGGKLLFDHRGPVDEHGRDPEDPPHDHWSDMITAATEEMLNEEDGSAEKASAKLDCLFSKIFGRPLIQESDGTPAPTSRGSGEYFVRKLH